MATKGLRHESNALHYQGVLMDWRGCFRCDSLRGQRLQTLSNRVLEAGEAIDQALSTLSGLRDDARLAVSNAIELSSYQAQHEAEVTTVMDNLFQAALSRSRACRSI